ncbi:meiosis-specific topoisomerase Spo11/meiotic recombination protein spo11 [Acrodontium crateriforme]|uniref:DNA topoisomerase (ATP-hydrolyzing) n=1 Tax=Acrodontium crateriforme TaxID=150365 RepID=A0AAQ3M9G9_9PEZI|nr:meiosis-specific topoisomerase Spo11/meiotic recombination protein spo11 [Acrodontium crateriforme]
MDNADFDDLDHLLGGDEMLYDPFEGPLTSSMPPESNEYQSMSLTSNPGEPIGLAVDISNELTRQLCSSERLSFGPKTDVKAKIEAIFDEMLDALLHKQDQLSLTLKVRRRQRAQQHSTANEVREKQITFPGKTPEEAWRFSVVVRILELVHVALRDDVVLSKRDIYYRDPALFGSQAYVDRYIDDIAYTFGTTRSALNITAAAKGLIVGAAVFCRKDGSLIEVRNDNRGVLVPPLADLLSADLTNVKWVLVVEKEATFRSIASSPFWKVLSSRGIAITAKGYPDIASRDLLNFLVTPTIRNGFASPTVYGLMDFDPDGIAIMSTYREGSIALAHEGETLCVPQMKWLGLRSEHILLVQDTTHGSQGLLRLTDRDRKKAREMLQDYLASSATGDEIASELQRMLMLNVKAELQLLDAIPNGIERLLETAVAVNEA